MLTYDCQIAMLLFTFTASLKRRMGYEFCVGAVELFAATGWLRAAAWQNSFSRFLRAGTLAFILLAAVACQGAGVDESWQVSLQVDGRTQTFAYASRVSVGELLASANIVLNERDRISHPPSMQIIDGMLVTVRRMREEQVCLRESLPYERQRIPYEGIAPNQEKLSQAGSAGLQEACYRVLFEDDLETGRELIGSPTIITEPRAEIVLVGPPRAVAALDLPGTLSYINNGAAWSMRGNTLNKRALPESANLDSLVFAVSPDGSRLIYTVASAETAKSFNELWMLSLDRSDAPIKLAPTDVLFAAWQPGSNHSIAYSTGARGTGRTTWKALNNLWLMQIDRQTGRARAIREIIAEDAGGPLGWWGTHFVWSPRGDRLAWVKADSVGAVDIESKQVRTLLEYPEFKTSGNWIWLSQVSWSPDGNIISATAHGAPLASEPASASPVFDLAMLAADGSFRATLRRSVGMWASPQFSPKIAGAETERADGYVAWLQAREAHNSIYSEYDLIIADRDGSNQRSIFPSADRPGIRKRDFGLTATDMTWSPDAQFIAVTYLGDIWLVHIATGASHQITFDGGASNPVWTG